MKRYDGMESKRKDANPSQETGGLFPNIDLEKVGVFSKGWVSIRWWLSPLSQIEVICF